MKRRIAKLISIIFIIQVFNVNSEVLQLEFTDTNGEYVSKPADTGYINPTSSVTFTVSAGLERFVKLSVLDSSENEVANAESSKISASDRVTYNGNEYYGVKLGVNFTGEGSYTVKIKTTDAAGSVISSESKSYILDITPPSFNGVWKWAAWGNSTNNMPDNHLIGPFEARRLWITDVNDINGIYSTKFYSVSEDGETIYKSGNAVFNVSTSEVGIGTNSYGSVNYYHFPYSDGPLIFKFEIFDPANNKIVVEKPIRWNGVDNTPYDLVGVYNPNYEGNFLEGSPFDNFEPVTPETQVHTNPWTAVYRVKKEDWWQYNVYGFSLGTRYCGDQPDYEDDVYVYKKVSGVYESGRFPYASRGTCSLTTWRKGSINHNLTLADDAPQSPKLVSLKNLLADKDWDEAFTYKRRNRPVTFLGARVTVEARDYVQIFKQIGYSCEIPPGETGCEVAMDTTYDSVVPYIFSYDWSLRNKENTLNDSGGSNLTIDRQLPVIDSIDFDNELKLVTINGQEYKTGASWGSVAIRRGYVVATKGSTSVKIVNQKLIRSGGNPFTSEVSLSELGEGTWELTAYAEDNYGNISEPFLVGEFINDSTGPIVDITADAVIRSLDQITINVEDMTTTRPTIKSINLSGGPAQDNVFLSSRENGLNSYKLEYPVMFPSSIEGEQYTLTVIAEDEFKNSTTATYVFFYEPETVTLNNGNIYTVPSTQEVVKDQSNVSLIQSEPATISGNLVTGTYDLIFTLRTDSGSGLIFNGNEISPGQTVTMNGYDFSANNSKLALPISFTDRAENEYTFQVTTTAPNTPVYIGSVKSIKIQPQVTFSVPTVGLTSSLIETISGQNSDYTSGFDVRNAMDSMKLAVQYNSSLSQICSVVRVVDNLNDLASYESWSQSKECFVRKEIGETPNPLTDFVFGSNLVTATGFPYLPVGLNKTSFDIAIKSGDSVLTLNKVEVQFNSTDPSGAIQTQLSMNKDNLPHLLYKDVVELDITSTLGCELTTDENYAKNVNFGLTTGPDRCLVEWTNLPAGLTQKAGSYKLDADMRTLGEFTVAWQVSVYSQTGVKNTIAQYSDTVTVVPPPEPVLSEMQAEWMYRGVVAGKSQTLFNKKDQVVKVTFNVEARKYNQSVTFQNKTCEIAAGNTACYIIVDNPIGFSNADEVGTAEFPIMMDSSSAYYGGVDDLFNVAYSFVPPSFEQLVKGFEQSSITLNGQTVNLSRNEVLLVLQTPHASAGTANDWWKLKDPTATFVMSDGYAHSGTVTVDEQSVVFDSLKRFEYETNFRYTAPTSGEVFGDKLVYRFDTTYLPDGKYDVTIPVVDSYNNGQDVSLSQIEFNKNAPEIALVVDKVVANTQRASELLFLDNVKVAITDGWNDSVSITGIEYNQQALGFEQVSENVFALNDSFLIPVGESGELTIHGQDSKGNSVTTAYPVSAGDMTFELRDLPAQTYSKIQNITASVRQQKGTSCSMQGDVELAGKMFNSIGKYGCMVETSLPDGMELNFSGTSYRISGAPLDTGIQTVSYNVYYYKNEQSRLVASGSQEIEVLPYDQIDLQLSTINQVSDGVYAVPYDLARITRYEAMAMPVETSVTISGPMGNAEETFPQRRSMTKYNNRRYIYKSGLTEEAGIWDQIDFNIQAAYVLDEDSAVSKNFKVIMGPHSRTRVCAVASETQITNLDEISVAVKVGVYSASSRDCEYTKEAVGEWDVFIAVKPASEYIPISETYRIDSTGQTNIVVKGSDIFESNKRIYALAKPATEIVGYKRLEISNLMTVVVLKGSGVEGEIESRKLEGEVPFNVTAAYKYDTYQDFQAIGAMVWQKSIDGTSWENFDSCADARGCVIPVTEAGKFKFRAKVVNKNSNIESYSNELEVIGYSVVDRLSIEGPRGVYPNQEVVYTASLYDRQEEYQIDQGLLEWSLDGGQTWVESAGDFVHSSTEDFTLMARYKLNSTADEVSNLGYKQASLNVRIMAPTRLNARAKTPYEAEVGETIQLEGGAYNSNRYVQSDVQYQWTTPSGQVINEMSSQYTITEADLVDDAKFVFSAWEVGYKDETIAIDSERVFVWKYTFPNHETRVRQVYKIAPTSASIDINRERRSFDKYADAQFTYSWVFDESAITEEQSSDNRLKVKINEPGLHEIKSVVTDNFGNSKEFVEFVEVLEPGEMVISASRRDSNTYLREPVAVSYRVSVDLEHPRDRPVLYDYYINGELIKEGTQSYQTLEFTKAGSYDVEIKITSEFGQQAIYADKINVVANQVPVCEPKIDESNTSLTVRSNCTDIDGRVIGISYAWDGNTMSGGSILTFSKNSTPSLDITITATDDSGGQSSYRLAYGM